MGNIGRVLPWVALVAFFAGCQAQVFDGTAYSGTGPVPTAAARADPLATALAAAAPLDTLGLDAGGPTDPLDPAAASPPDPLGLGAAGPLVGLAAAQALQAAVKAGPITEPDISTGDPSAPASPADDVPNILAAVPDLSTASAGPALGPAAHDVIRHFGGARFDTSAGAPTAAAKVAGSMHAMQMGPASAPNAAAAVAGRFSGRASGPNTGPGSARTVADPGFGGRSAHSPVAMPYGVNVTTSSNRLADAAKALAPSPNPIGSGLGYQGVQGNELAYEPVPRLPLRDPNRERVASNIVFTLTGANARLNGGRLFIQGAAPVVTYIATAPAYRSGVVNTSFWTTNLTTPAGWLGNPDAVLYGTRNGMAVAVVLNIQTARFIEGAFLADVMILPREVGPLFSDGIVATVQSNALAGADGNGLTIMSMLPGGVRWSNVALVIDSVLKDLRPASGSLTQPLQMGEAATQFACSSPALWKLAFCVDPPLAPSPAPV